MFCSKFLNIKNSLNFCGSKKLLVFSPKRGKYDSSIKSWRDYLVYRGKNPIEKRHSLNLLESILEDPETGGLP